MKTGKLRVISLILALKYYFSPHRNNGKYGKSSKKNRAFFILYLLDTTLLYPYIAASYGSIYILIVCKAE